MHPIIKYGSAFAGALDVFEQFDARKVAAGALITEQSTLDALKNGGGITRVSAVTKTDNEKDWDGLTPEQEREKDDERLSRQRQEEARAEAEYEQAMHDVREKADRLMVQLDEQRRECLEKLAEADARAIVLPDGRRVLVGDKPGVFIAEDTGKTLEGDDKAKAQSLQKPNSETAAERKKLTDELQQNEDAREHLQKAQSISREDGKNLSPEEKKQKEAETQRELAIAAAKAKGVPDLDTGGPAGDIGAALGLDSAQGGRTTSFAATLDEKDSRATGLQDHFTGAAQPPDTPPPPAADNNPAPAGATPRPQISQQNQ